MKNFVKTMFLFLLAFLLFGCTNAVELVDELETANDSEIDLEDEGTSSEEEFHLPNGDLDDGEKPEEQPNPEEGDDPEQPNPEEGDDPEQPSNPDEGDDPEDEDLPFPGDPIDDIWMPTIKMPDVRITLDYVVIEDLNNLFLLYMNLGHYQSIMITIKNPVEPVLVNEETIAYTKAKIIEYGIDQLDLAYTWYTNTIYIHPDNVTYEQLVSLFSLGQKNDVFVTFDIYFQE